MRDKREGERNRDGEGENKRHGEEKEGNSVKRERGKERLIEIDHSCKRGRINHTAN